MVPYNVVEHLTLAANGIYVREGPAERREVQFRQHPFLRILQRENNQTVRIFCSERTEKEIVERAERHGGSTDAERQREHGDDGEAAVFFKIAQGIAKILPNPTQEPVHAPPPGSQIPDIIH